MLKLRLHSVLWLLNAKNWLLGKDPDPGKDWMQEEKGLTEDEMVGWHNWLRTWVWASSRSWWWTGKPGMLQSMRCQRVRHNWATELNWTLSTPSSTPRLCLVLVMGKVKVYTASSSIRAERTNQHYSFSLAQLPLTGFPSMFSRCSSNASPILWWVKSSLS